MKRQLRDERRTLQRVTGHSTGPVTLQAPGLPDRVHATVRDISIKGIGLVSACHIEPGTTVAIQRRLTSKAILAKVMQATRMSDATWLLGCSFARLLTVDEIMGLG